MTAVMPSAGGRPGRPAGEPPTPEALAEFARQGTFWEPPRRGVDDDADALTVAAGSASASAGDDPPTAPVSPVDVFGDTVPAAPAAVRTDLPRFLEPEPDFEAAPDVDLSPGAAAALAIDPPLRADEAAREPDSMLFRTLGDAGDRPAGAAGGSRAGDPHAAAGGARADARPRPRGRGRRRLPGRPPQRRARRASGRSGGETGTTLGDVRRHRRRRRRRRPGRTPPAPPAAAPRAGAATPAGAERARDQPGGPRPPGRRPALRRRGRRRRGPRRRCRRPASS